MKLTLAGRVKLRICILNDPENSAILLSANLKPAAHGEERAEQTASRGGLLSRFLTVCGELLMRNWPREAVRKKSNMFDIFRLARQIPHCVRPL